MGAGSNAGTTGPASGRSLLRQQLLFQLNLQPIRSCPRSRSYFGYGLHRLCLDQDAPGVRLEDAQLPLRLNHHGIRPFVPPRPSLARCIKLARKFDQVGVHRLCSFSNPNAIGGRRSIA